MPTLTPSVLAESSEVFSPQWLEQASADLDPDGRELLARAGKWAAQHLLGARASTGEPLDSHCAGAALILADLGADAPTRASALLCTVTAPRDNDPSHTEALHAAFGTEIVELVQGARALLRLSHVSAKQRKDPHGSSAAQTSLPPEGALPALGAARRREGPHEEPGSGQKEMRRKMLLAMAADLRIVLLRLASRLQSLRWYAASREPCPLHYAQETMELYTPLANRLGIWQLKWEMEDLAFRFLQPDIYKDIARQLDDRRQEREALIASMVEQLEQALHKAGVRAKVFGRPKHIYSIWNKMRNKNLAFNQLYDLRAMRVIVDDERACYAALALVHSLWTPVAEEFDDYISRPKPNGYRSLHTVVADAQGRTFEIQIRTQEMHVYAEYGLAAHWRYKEAGAKGGTQQAGSGYDKKIAWMRRLLAWEKEGGATSGGAPEAPQQAQASERIYVMTPQARVIELPAKATPVDFAYALHTDLGHRCRGARVDGAMVPLSTQLKTGQTVEIIAAKSGGPSRDWLNPQLGYLASQRSRAKVRAWFNAIELQARISQGQELVEKELQRLGKTAVNLEHLAQQLGFAKADDLYVAVAKDEFSLRQIDAVIKAEGQPPAQEEPVVFTHKVAKATQAGNGGVLVMGVDSLMTQLARCCRPAPPDGVAGFVTRGRGVSVHREDCAAYQALVAKHPERAIAVAWGDTTDAVYPVDIAIHAQQSQNLLRDLSEVFSRLRLNVISVNTQSRASLAHMVFTVEARDGAQIAKALAALNELEGVSAARR